MSLGQFYTELEQREAALEDARAKLHGPDTDPADLAYYRELSTDFAEWRRAIRLLGGRPDAGVEALVGVGAHDPTVTTEEN